jgi:hypothetical protein
MKAGNSLRISRYLTGLCLVLLAPGAWAHCAGKHTGDHPHCIDDAADPMALPFLVAILSRDGIEAPEIPLYQPYDYDNYCLAEAHDHSTNFDIVFRSDREFRACAALTTTNPEISVLPALGLHVTRDKRSGEVVSVWFQGRNPEEELVYISDEMVASPPADVEPRGDGEFIIHLHVDNVVLRRCNSGNFKRNTVCDDSVGTFALDDIWYFPNPAAK